MIRLNQGAVNTSLTPTLQVRGVYAPAPPSAESQRLPGPPRVNQRLWPHPPEITPAQRDPALQTSRRPWISVTSGVNFDGIDEHAQQAASGLLAVPADTNGAVGASQFVQWVNYAFAVYDKTTGKLAKNGGPFAGNSLWTRFGAPCETNNSGDPIAQYDKVAGRWVLTQPDFTNPFYICFAVSQTSDATGAYYRYAFPMPNFPDYPKLGIWPDAYYMSVDLYTGQGIGGKFLGAYPCAFDRLAMLAGRAATVQCFPLTPKYASLLPSDLDGSRLPPAGSPNYFLNLGANSLNFWKFSVDFAHPANSTLTPPTNRCRRGSGRNLKVA